MNLAENSPVLIPPIISDLDSAQATVSPPIVGDEKLVVPPILTEEQKNPPQKNEKKTAAQILYSLLVWLTHEEMVGTWSSFAVHFFLLMLLAMIVSQPPQLTQGLLVGGFSQWEDGIDDGDGLEIKLENIEPEGNLTDLVVPNISQAPVQLDTVIVGETANDSQNQADRTEKITTNTDWGSTASASGDPAKIMASGGGFAESRTDANRGKRGGPGDPTDESEKTVEAGLRWIAIHQDSDGGWNFDLGNCGKRGECSNPGKQPKHSSRTAATAIAVLPFLGAGYTHLDGQYRLVVKRGLQFLLDSRNSVETSVGQNLTQDAMQGMYAQGIATLALCEAYGMTRGKAKTKSDQEFEIKLREAAQNAIRYIEYAQVQQGQFVGGWRYRAGESPGDLSVSGWQMLALKSGLLSGLQVKSTTLTRAELFLNSTQYDEGRRFNYLPVRFPYSKELDSKQSVGRYEDSPYTCTAIGLLLRMYLGAKPGFQPLDEGIGYLDRWGGLKSETKTRSAGGHCNLYYAYYGTLAMKHYGGSTWIRWYPELRDFLVQTQATAGHEGGSWFFPDPYCDIGGRLLNTAFAIMILEAPYRHFSLYDTN